MKKKLVIILLYVFILNLLTGVASAASGFSDVKKNHWAFNAISQLSQNGFISGYDDGTFKPDNNITRAEFVAILDKILRDRYPDGSPWSFNNSKTFSDVPQSYWAYGSIKNVLSFMLESDADAIWGAQFVPEKKITREEVAAIIWAVCIAEPLDVSLEKCVTFQDIGKSRHLEGILSCVALKIMSGYPDNTFRPNNSITRAETAVVLTKFWQMKKQQ